MTDTLRTRIAATMLRIFDEDQTLTVEMGAWIVADAVIREVLTPEFLADLVIQALQKAADDDR